jgi:hypothetical protein
MPQTGMSSAAKNTTASVGNNPLLLILDVYIIYSAKQPTFCGSFK